MERTDKIKQIFDQSIDVKSTSAKIIATPVADSVELILQALMEGKKILTCGNGGSAADAQHFSSEMLNRFERDRPGLPALALTTDASTLTSIANDYQFADVFSKQIRALGSPGDILIAFSTSGNSDNIIAAIDAAHERELKVILITGRDGGEAAELLSTTDVEVRVPADSTARIQEVHLTVIHCICELVDDHLLGN